MRRQYTRDGRNPLPDTQAVSRVMSANKAIDTGPELLLRKSLGKIGVRGYRIHKRGVPGRPDIAFLGKKVAVFVNGCYWHRCPRCNLPLPKTHTQFWSEKFQRNKERDIRKIDCLESSGWKVITVWECEIKGNVEEVADKIRRALED